MLPASWNADLFRGGVWSFLTLNLRSLGQRATKLLTFKAWGLKKVCCSAPALLKPVGPGSTLPWFESFSKFEGRQICSHLTYRSYIHTMERSKLLLCTLAVQETGIILKVFFALSMWPHFDSVNLLRGSLFCSQFYPIGISYWSFWIDIDYLTSKRFTFYELHPCWSSWSLYQILIKFVYSSWVWQHFISLYIKKSTST